MQVDVENVHWTPFPHVREERSTVHEKQIHWLFSPRVAYDWLEGIALSENEPACMSPFKSLASD
jgi:hypothetical protein